MIPADSASSVMARVEAPFAIAAFDRAVVSPQGAALLVRLLDRYSATEAVPLSPAMRNLRSVFSRVAAADSGTTEQPRDAEAARSIHDEIGIPEAAHLLEISREYAGRLAREGALGDTRRRGNRRYVDRAEVEAYAMQRRASSS